MESMIAYIIAVITTLTILLLSAIIATLIKFEGGSKPTDSRKRKMWFWILCLVTPVTIFLVGILSTPDGNRMEVERYMTALSIGTISGFFVYILLGFVLSRIFKNGKLGHWF
jgi:hypothetical protein